MKNKQKSTLRCYCERGARVFGPIHRDDLCTHTHTHALITRWVVVLRDVLACRSLAFAFSDNIWLQIDFRINFSIHKNTRKKINFDIHRSSTAMRAFVRDLLTTNCLRCHYSFVVVDACVRVFVCVPNTIYSRRKSLKKCVDFALSLLLKLNIYN